MARRIELVSILLASLAAVAALWYSNVQVRQANDQARQERALVKEGQITDRYTAAVGNLGADRTDVRLGGIYALQRIMQDSPVTTRPSPTSWAPMSVSTRRNRRRRVRTSRPMSTPPSPSWLPATLPATVKTSAWTSAPCGFPGSSSSAGI